MSNKMWGGRFGESPDAIMEEINVSIDVDQHLYAQDIAASKAHAAMLAKPGSVHRREAGWATIPLGPELLPVSSNQPGRQGGAAHMPSLFGLAPGGVCHAVPVAGPAVRPYRTLSPLPHRNAAVSFLWHFPWGRPRRTLSGTVAPWSPDFPPAGNPRRAAGSRFPRRAKSRKGARPDRGARRRPSSRPHNRLGSSVSCLSGALPTRTNRRRSQIGAIRSDWASGRSAIRNQAANPVRALLREGGLNSGHPSVP